MFPDLVHLEHVARDLWRPGPFGGATVMIGAGFSRNAVPGPGAVGGSGMPVWSQLTDALVDDLYPMSAGSGEQRDWARRRAGSVSGAMRLADEYEAQRGRTALDQVMLRAIPDADYEPGPAHRLLCSLPWADVLTTNYDTLIERTLPDVPERHYTVVRGPEDLPGAVRPRIAKLHGSFPSSRPFVITEEDFRLYEGRAAAFVNLARQAFVETSVCLLGFSGDDPNFLRWSGWTRDVLGSARVNPIYLCGVLELTPSQRALLQTRHVLPIDVAPLFPTTRWPDRDRRMAAATEWLLLALEAGRPIDLSNWPEQTTHQPTTPSLSGLPDRPSFAHVGGLAVEESMVGFRPLGEPEPATEPWSPDLTREEQIERAQRSLAEHTRRMTGDPLRRQIDVVTRAWATNRRWDPGWVVPPQRNRDVIWSTTEPWIGPITSTVDEAVPELRLVRLDELTWRLDRCLVPMGGDVGRACETTLAAVATAGDGGLDDPVRRLHSPIRSRWLGLAGRLLRHRREACADDAFDALAARLRCMVDLDPDLGNLVAHEQALALLERFRPIEAEAVVRGWLPTGDPVWFARRAGLLAEFDGPDALDAASDVLRRVRSGRAASDGRNRRVRWLSREAMALILVRCVGIRWERRDFDPSARFVEIGQAGCDPRGDLDILGAALARPPDDVGDSWAERRSDRAPPMQVRARQLRRAHEDLGQPVKLIGVMSAAAAGVRRSVPWTTENDPDAALRAFVRLCGAHGSTRFSPRWLARASEAIVAGLADATCDYLEAMVGALADFATRSTGRDDQGRRLHRPGELRNEHTRVAVQLGLLVLPRLEVPRVLRFVSACLSVRAAWRGGEWQTWGSIGQACREALEELPDDARGEVLLAVLRQPIAGRDVDVAHDGGDASDPVFAFLVRADDGPRRDASWDDTVADMLDVVASDRPQPVRAQALRRLWALHTRQVLTDEERSRLCEAVWATDVRRPPDEGGSIPDIPRLEMGAAELRRFPLPFWNLIFLPEPSGGAASRLVQAYLANAPLPRFRGATGGSHDWTFGPSASADPIRQILTSTSRPWTAAGRRLDPFEWSHEKVEGVIARIEAWWDSEGPDFCRWCQAGDPGPLPLPSWRTSTIIEFMAYVVLPSCASRPHVLRRCVRLGDVMEEVGIDVDLLVPMRLAAGAMGVGDAETALRQASSALDPGRSLAFLNAVLVWMALSERGSLPPLPTDLVREVAAGVRSRRLPDLAWALQVARVMMERPGEPWSELMLPDLAIGLQHLARETRPDAPIGRFALQSHDVMIIRGEAAALLETLAPLLNSDGATARAWLENDEAETTVLIRRRLSSARERMRRS